MNKYIQIKILVGLVLLGMSYSVVSSPPQVENILPHEKLKIIQSKLTKEQKSLIDKRVANAIALKLNHSNDLFEMLTSIEQKDIPALAFDWLEENNTLSGGDSEKLIKLTNYIKALTKVDYLPELWLHKGMPVNEKLNVAELVIAVSPYGDESKIKTITGYHIDGSEVLLDAHIEPAFPVLMVDSQGYHAFQRNISTLNFAFKKAGMQRTQNNSMPTSGKMMLSEKSIETTQLTRILATKDFEPWFKGAPEFYVLVNGVFDSSNDPQIKAVALPYLSKTDKYYYPYQILVNWSDYQYNVVNMLVYEDDSGQNYGELASKLIRAVRDLGVLSGQPELAAIAEITQRVLEIMPSDWLTDDDDFADVFYSVEKGVEQNRWGAGEIFSARLTPFTITSN